jgi:transcriptional regulator with XRE-family HTH domain
MTSIEFRSWRAAMGWTQARAGDALGVTGRAVRMWEAGDRRVPETVSKLCALLARDNADQAVPSR